MPATNISRNSFSAGAVSPRLMGRTDLDQFRAALRDCTNFVSTIEGSIARRPGEEFLDNAKFPDQPVLFLDFFVTERQTYQIEAGPQYFRFWTKNGLLLTDLGAPVEVTTPYSAQDLSDPSALQIVQDGDEATIVHERHVPHLLTRTSANTFTFAAETYLQGRAPLGLLNYDDNKKITLSGTYPTLTATSTSATFTADDVGRAIFVRDTTNSRALYGTITAFSSATVVSVTGTFLVGSALPAQSVEWALGLFSPGYGCRAVTIHEGRKWYGGFRRARDFLVGSVSGSFNNFESLSPNLTASSAVNNDRAITRRVSTGGGGSATIYWLASTLEQLVVGTGTGQYLIQPGVTGILTPLEARALRATGRPMGVAQGVVVDGQVYFVQRGGSRLRRLELQAEDGSYTTTDMSLVSSHLTNRGIRKIVYQQEPWSVMWALMADGSLVGQTFEKDRLGQGAHRHVFGGDLLGEPPRVVALGLLPGENARPSLATISGREGAFSLHSVGTAWGFENATLTADWTVSPSGAFTSETAALGATPLAGTRMAVSSEDPTPGSGTAVMERTVALSTVPGWSAALTDAGRARALGRVSFWLPSVAYGASRLELQIVPLDATDAPLPQNYYGTNEGWPLELATQPTEQWVAAPFRSALLPAGTRSVRVRLRLISDGQVRWPVALDAVLLNVVQTAVEERRPPGENEDRLLVCVRRTIAGQQVQQIGFLGPSATPPLPGETRSPRERAFYLGYLDASLLIEDARPVAWAADVGGDLRFSLASGAVLPAGTEVAFHNMVWRAGETLVSALENEPVFLLDASNEPAGFRVSRTPGGPPVRREELGLPGLSLWEGLVLSRQPVLNVRVRSIGGLEHLEAEHVTALVDGREHTNLQVQNGRLTLPETGSVVRVGLPYTSRAQTTPFSLGDPASNSFLGTPMVVSRVSLRLNYTAGKLRVGTPGAPLVDVRALTMQAPASGPPPLVTGDFVETVPAVAGSEPGIVIETNSAYPVEVLSLTAAVQAQAL